MSLLVSSFEQIKQVNASNDLRLGAVSRNFAEQVISHDEVLDKFSELDRINLRYYLVTFKREEDAKAFYEGDNLWRLYPCKKMNEVTYVYPFHKEVDLAGIFRKAGVLGFSVFEIKREVAIDDEGLPFVYPAFENQYEDASNDKFFVAQFFVPEIDKELLDGLREINTSEEFTLKYGGDWNFFLRGIGWAYRASYLDAPELPVGFITAFSKIYDIFTELID